MMVLSCATVRCEPAPFSAGTNGETPPLPWRPWHCAQANWTKTCAPVATSSLTFVAPPFWTAPTVTVFVTVFVPHAARPTAAISATAMPAPSRRRAPGSMRARIRDPPLKSKYARAGSGQAPEQDAEESVAVRRLRERSAAGHELRVDEAHQGPERDVLRERERQGELLLVKVGAAPHGVEGQAEGGSVRRVQEEADRAVPAAEERDVRVAAPEDATVERLLKPPDERCGCSRGTGTNARRHYACSMPEGDALHRAARRLQVLVGEHLEVETPHPRAAVKQLAPRLDGRRLESVEAVGKNLLLTFSGGIVVRSHLRMKGRWLVVPRDAAITGMPWLVLRGDEHVGLMFNGAVLELDRGVKRRLGPDILAEPPEYEAMLARFRQADQARQVGDVLLDQRVVAGIGNMWKAESLWAARVSPWRPLAEVADGELRAALEEAHRLMRGRLDGVPGKRHVYRRKGRPCPRCGTGIRSWPQGDGARMAYWCSGCQRGEEPGAA
jgi:endonuclease VIII